MKINKISDKNKKSQFLKNYILNIVIGGDGFMLKILKKVKILIVYFMGLILEIMVS